MLSQLHCLSEGNVIRDVLHLSDLKSPNILKIQLNSLDRQQIPKQSVVLFNHIRAKYQVQGPMAAVVKTKATPRVLLLLLTASAFTYKTPILNVRVVH